MRHLGLQCETHATLWHCSSGSAKGQWGKNQPRAGHWHHAVTTESSDMGMGRSWAPALVPPSLLHQFPWKDPGAPQSGPMPLGCTLGPRCCASATVLPSWSLWVCGSGISRQRGPGASWVSLGLSGCQGMQGTGPGSSWLGQPDAIPCLQNISLPRVSQGCVAFPQHLQLDGPWEPAWLWNGIQGTATGQLQPSRHGHGQLVTDLAVLWGLGPREPQNHHGQPRGSSSAVCCWQGWQGPSRHCQCCWLEVPVPEHCGCTLLTPAWGC